MTMRASLVALAALAASCGLLAGAPKADAQVTSTVVTTCGTAGPYTAGGTRQYPTMDVNGNACATPGGRQAAPLAVVTTDKSGTVATGGVAQTPIALNADRKVYCIQNPSATASGVAAESLWIRVNGTAAANVGTELANGTQACESGPTIDTAAVSVFAATTGHKFNGFEKQ